MYLYISSPLFPKIILLTIWEISDVPMALPIPVKRPGDHRRLGGADDEGGAEIFQISCDFHGNITHMSHSNVSDNLSHIYR